MDEGLSLSECLFRIGSDAYLSIFREARELHTKGLIEVSESDMLILEKLYTGDFGIYKGKKVALDVPRRVRDKDGVGKKFIVFRPNRNLDKDENGLYKAVRIVWGDPNYEIRNDDKDAADNFQSRHNCKAKKDQWEPGWWACNVHLFHKQLGLVSDYPW